MVEISELVVGAGWSWLETNEKQGNTGASAIKCWWLPRNPRVC